MTGRAAVVCLAAWLGGCAAPHFYVRQTLVLDGPGLADFRVRHDGSGDCLWDAQRWPSLYEVDRGPYRLAVTAPVRYAGEPLVLDLELRGDDALRLQVEGAPSAEHPLSANGVRRHRVQPARDSGSLRISIRRDGHEIGFEAFAFRVEECRALLWRGDTARR